MRSFGQFLVAGLFVLVGCADATFDLLPKAAPAPDKPTGDSGEVGMGDAPGAAGLGGRGGRGGSGGSGGFGDMSQGGEGNGPNGCGPSGCGPIMCKPEDGYCLRNEDCSQPTAYCSEYRCVNCRPAGDCPAGENCEHDCMPDE